MPDLHVTSKSHTVKPVSQKKRQNRQPALSLSQPLSKLSEVRALPGDVIRRSPKRPAEVFDGLVQYLKRCESENSDSEMTVLRLVEHSSWLEVDLMFEFLVFHATLKVFEDDASAVISFRDMLGQDARLSRRWPVTATQQGAEKCRAP